MPRNPLALLALASAPLAVVPHAALAQQVTGSGIVPSTAANSAERPIAFASAMPADVALAVVMTDGNLPDLAGTLPADAAQRIAAAEFTGKDGEMLELPAAAGAARIVLFGATLDGGEAIDWRKVGGQVIKELGSEDAPIAIAGLPDAEATAQAALGAALAQYRFDRYKSDREDTPTQPITFTGPSAMEARGLWTSRQMHLAEGVRLARDLVNEPANVIYPESFIARSRAALAGAPNVTIEVLDEADFRRLGMGAIAGVGQGSPRGSRMMIVTYRGADGPPIALAGKGITFDTGGISLKPNAGMWEMKGDMSGAAAVTGAVLSLAKSRAPVHVVAVAALAENMPDGNAQRPGDVLRTLSGKTIEIRSTDAEGRLVLSDAIEYTVREKNPFALVDIATLTGSAVGALGPEYAALFAREDDYAEAALEAGQAVDEPVWRLPLNEAYRKAIRSDIADIKNSDATPAPGASAGAHFIEFFVPEDLPWIHLDMAAVDRGDGTNVIVPAGARGWGVMLLDHLARTWRPR